MALSGVENPIDKVDAAKTATVPTVSGVRITMASIQLSPIRRSGQAQLSSTISAALQTHSIALSTIKINDLITYHGSIRLICLC